MKSGQPPRRSGRRLLSALTALALGAGVGLVAAPQAQAAEETVSGATFTWGLNGYAQKGIFGPWTFKDLEGNVTQLVGSVTTTETEPQTEYLVDPVPATSMPASNDPEGNQKTPNAVKFTAGTGMADPVTGAADITWEGAYTVNAYPAMYGAPDEIYSDPELTVAPDGSGELTMEFALGAGQDMEGNPTPAEEFGRVTMMTFDAGSLSDQDASGYRVTPDYQGVEVTFPEGEGTQTRNCTTDGGATGWWGSWPEDFVLKAPTSVRPHFYSTGCGGNQDLKPALPFDVSFDVQPTVTVSQTTVMPDGTTELTVEGEHFDPAKATGTRPPLANKPAGVYINFGKYADVWQPSAAASSATRKNVDTSWAVLAEDMATIGGPEAGAVELEPDGSFTATVSVDKAAADELSETGNYGIYTYAGSGAVQALYETATPITFAKSAVTAKLSKLKKPKANKKGSVQASLKSLLAGPAPEGSYTLVFKKGKKALSVSSKKVGTCPTAFSLPKTGSGKYKLLLSYTGSVNHQSDKAVTTFKIN